MRIDSHRDYPRSLSNSPTSVLAATTKRKSLVAYALPLPQRVGDELLDQFLFGQASRTAKLYKTLLRFSQRSPKLLHIALLPDRDVDREPARAGAHPTARLPKGSRRHGP